MASVEVETCLRDEVNSIDFDFEMLGNLFEETDIPDSELNGLRIVLRKTAPSEADFLTRRHWQKRVLGAYSPNLNNPQIHLNIPLIKKRLESQTGDDYSEVFLHEFGHFADHTERDIPRVSGRDGAIFAGWLGAIAVPSYYTYHQTGNTLAAVGVAVAGVFVGGRALIELEQRGFTSSGQKEVTANEFSDTRMPQYSHIISVT